MQIRQLGLHVQELEAGPLTFLLSHSVPVAYRDTRAEAMPPGVFRTDAHFGKATTRHLNQWLKDKKPYATIPHELIIQAFEAVSRWGQVEPPKADPDRWRMVPAGQRIGW